MIRKNDLMTLEEVAELLPGRTVRWVREHLVGENRVDSVNFGARSIYIVRQSFYNYVEAQTSRVKDARAILQEKVMNRMRMRGKI